MTEEFDKYVSNYDLNDPNIKLKFNHSYRVMELSEKYAKILNFNEEDIALAKLIGLLHDIGRFEQLKLYNSYDDNKTVDHADYSVEQLFENGLINRFWKNEEDYEIIKFAIKNHNKRNIPDIKNERMLMHAKLIRDADKLDIMYLFGFLGELDIKATDEEISKEIIYEIDNYNTADYNYVNNTNDQIAAQFAFAFDINNNECLEELKQNITYFYKKVEKENKFKCIYDKIINYIEKRIDEYVEYKI